MSTLFHLIYVSRAVRALPASRVESILAVSRLRNAALNLTGMLLYADDSFIQTLEGARADVEKVFASIAKDPRHSGVTVLAREPIAARNFAGWSMGFERLADPRIADSFQMDLENMRARLHGAAADVKGMMLGFVDITSRRPC
jgi:hypothetical protein